MAAAQYAYALAPLDLIQTGGSLTRGFQAGGWMEADAAFLKYPVKEPAEEKREADARKAPPGGWSNWLRRLRRRVGREAELEQRERAKARRHPAENEV